MRFYKNAELRVIYVQTIKTGSTGTVFTGSVVDLTDFRGGALFLATCTTSSTAGANDKVVITLQHSTSSTHSDPFDDAFSFLPNSTGSAQVRMFNADELKRYVRMKAVMTGSFAVGLCGFGITT